MNTSRAYQESDPLESHLAKQGPLCHQCPVCGTLHEIRAVRAQFAYGRQLSCSPDCEAERRRRSRASYRRTPSLVRGEVLADRGFLARLSSRAGVNAVPLKLKSFESVSSGGTLKTARDAESNRNQDTRHAAGAGEHKAGISATVELADILPVRRAIFQAGGASVGILKTAPVRHSSKVRVFIEMKPGALDSIMIAIMRSVSACEFGRVVRM